MRKLSSVALVTTSIVLLSAGFVMAQGGHHGFGGPDAQGRQNGQRGHMHIENMIDTYDQNGDGAITQVEIDTVRAARLTEFDSDGNGTLNLAEYQSLWLDAMHERMVDRFQGHDDDGDGEITAEEFGEGQARMVRRMDRNDDGQIDPTDFERRRPNRDQRGRGGEGQRGQGPRGEKGANE